MNQTQIHNFLECLAKIDDLNYLALHSRAASFRDTNKGNFTFSSRSTLTTGEELGHNHDHDHNHHNDSSSSELLVAKITAMIVLFIASMICGSVPFLLNRWFKWTEKEKDISARSVIIVLLYFGGGVLLCTTFLHLLPEVQETIDSLQECDILPKLSFSLAELLMCSGFFLMYLIEYLVHAYMHRNRRILEESAGAAFAFERGYSIRKSYLIKGVSIKNQDHVTAESTTLDKNGKSETLESNAGVSNASSLSVQNLMLHDMENQKYQTADVSNNKHPCQHGHSHLPIAASNNNNKDMVSSLRGLFIVLALSLHELFEGMSIGLESSAGAVWFMFAAVSAHKFVLAFCVGVELIVSGTRASLTIIYVSIFAIVSPIGIGIGILISNHEDTSTPSVPSAVLQGLACGTLLYVVFFEILNKNQFGFKAYIALIMGFAIMFGLQQLGSLEHGHSHGGCGLNHEHNYNIDIDDKTMILPGANGFTQDNTFTDSKAENFEKQLKLLRDESQKLMEKTT